MDKVVMVRLTGAQYTALQRLVRTKGGLPMSTFLRMTLVECLKLPTNGEPERYEAGT